MTNQKQIAFMIVALLLAGWIHASAHAGPLEDGQSAFARKDYQTAFKVLLPLAEQGNSEAQFGIGAMYLNGAGTKEDDAAAAKWIQKAADQGLTKAQDALGKLYENGIGVKEDNATALEWYRKAAAQGNAHAQKMKVMLERPDCTKIAGQSITVSARITLAPDVNDGVSTYSLDTDEVPCSDTSFFVDDPSGQVRCKEGQVMKASGRLEGSAVGSQISTTDYTCH